MTTSPQRSARTMSRRRFLALAGAGAIAVAGGLTVSARSFASGSTSETPLAQTSLSVFDTVVNIRADADQSAVDATADLCRHYEQLFSARIETSDVARINAAGGAPVEVDADTADIIARAIERSRASNGLFDITIGGASLLWDFVNGIEPSSDDLAQAVQHIGYTGISVEGTTVQLADPRAQIDLGGIGKGYVGQKLADYLVAHGAAHALLDLGGDEVLVGGKPGGGAWAIGVRDPQGGPATLARIDRYDGAVATSGIYERSFEMEGQLLHHILDPRTGRPRETDLASATAICAEGADADALATTLILQGSTAALAAADTDASYECVLVTRDGEVLRSAGV